MSRVFFISSNVVVDPYPVYPLGMAVVSGALASAGHEVFQYDCLVHGDDLQCLKDEILRFAPDVISLSLRNIDNVDSFSGDDGWYLHRAKKLVATIREAVAVPVVVGGPALTIMPEAIAEYLEVDYAIIGEGEFSLPELVRKLSVGETVDQIIPRSETLAGDQFSVPLFDQQMVDYFYILALY